MYEKDRYSDRRNIRSQARHMHIDGFKKSKDDPLTKTYSSEFEKIEAWDALKEEKNALTAIISDRVINRAMNLRQEFPPFGLARISLFENPKPIQTFTEQGTSKLQVLEKGMTHTLKIALDQEIDQLEQILTDKGTDDPIKSVYDRYKEILKFGNDTINFDQRRPKDRVEAGINTAVDIVTSFVEVLPLVYTRQFPTQQLDPAILKTILQNSYPLLVDLAASHIQMFAEKTRELTKNGFFVRNIDDFDPIHFIITVGKNPRLTITEKKANKFKKLEAGPIIGSSNITTGCPALVNFNGGSAIRKLWDWNIELAEALYREQYQSHTSESPFEKNRWYTLFKKSGKSS